MGCLNCNLAIVFYFITLTSSLLHLLILLLMIYEIGSASGVRILFKKRSDTTWILCFRAFFICLPIFRTLFFVDMTAATRTWILVPTFPPNFWINRLILTDGCLNLPTNTNSILKRSGFLYGLWRGGYFSTVDTLQLKNRHFLKNQLNSPINQVIALFINKFEWM